MKLPEDPDENDPFKTAATIISQLFLVFGGAIPYIPQYAEIVETENTNGFSLYVSLALVLASLLRISYWFGRHFENALLLNSIVMVIVMLAMIELRLRIDRKRGRFRNEHYFLDLQFSYFWKWTELLSYIEAMMFVLITSSFIVIFLGWIPGVTEGVGYAALLTESLLPFPQFLSNYTNKTTHGMNKAMVCLWGLGDLFKIVYFFLRSVPMPFLLGACIQFTLDLLILAQIFFYGDRPKVRFSDSD